MAKETAPKGLNPQQEKFCRLYATDREFFGNGFQAYVEAYDVEPKGYKAAMVSASRLLRNPKILDRINALLEVTLNDQHVDKQLALVITQNADLKSKVAAIKEYNALRSRIKTKVELTGKDGGPISLSSLFESAKEG